MELLLHYLWQASPLVNPEEQEQSPYCLNNQTNGINISCGLFWKINQGAFFNCNRIYMTRSWLFFICYNMHMSF